MLPLKLEFFDTFDNVVVSSVTPFFIVLFDRIRIPAFSEFLYRAYIDHSVVKVLVELFHVFVYEASVLMDRVAAQNVLSGFSMWF